MCATVIKPEEINDLPTARKVIELLLEANARNERRIAALEREVKEHKEQLEEARRAGRRQAGPFSHGEPKATPKKPGQKPGHEAMNREIPEKIWTLYHFDQLQNCIHDPRGRYQFPRVPISQPVIPTLYPSVASFALTSPTDGSVSVLPSGNIKVGTLSFPLLMSLTRSAADASL